ncbi:MULTISPECIES: hypothetical protein [unclassified Streptosporangium]|nr:MULTISPECIES: hypothetical protein [unclassified Streptosporangium]
MAALRALREQQFTERSGHWNDGEEHGIAFLSLRGTPMEPDNP